MKISTLAFASLLLAAACDQSKSPAVIAPAQAVVAAPSPVAAAAQPMAAGDPAPIAVGTKLKCPVSGEDFTVKDSTRQVVYNGKRYAFCCSDCQPEFAKNPAKYAAK